MNIVVIEDEYRIRHGLCQLIPKLDPDFHVVGSAENGYDGMYLIKEKLPDVVICDVEMKVMNGLNMIKQLNDLNISCVYLILSGYSEFEYARTAIDLGVKRYLLKPIMPEDLKKNLLAIKTDLDEQLVEKRKQEQEIHYSYLVQSVIDKIHENYKFDLSLKEIADSLEVSQEYLSTLFTKETKENYSSFLRRVRMEKACELIQTTDKKMYEIAFLVGFDNPQYFNNVFKSVYGMTPKAYMKLCRTELSPSKDKQE